MKECNFVSADDLSFGLKSKIIIKDYSKLKPFGGKLHRVPELDGWEFRLSKFTIGIKLPNESQLCIPKYLLHIPIPWMRNDHSFVVMIK